MRIEITQDPSGTGDYRWEIHTGPERIDSYTGYCYSLGECFEEIVKWNTLNALHYTEETETEKLNLLHRYKKQTPEEVAEGLRNAMKQAKEDGVFDEPTKPMDEVVDRLVKKYQAQKLWNRVRDELGYSIDLCDEINLDLQFRRLNENKLCLILC